MDIFLMMYRSTTHSTTGVIPAELLFGRKNRTKLPQLQEFTCEGEVRDPTVRQRRKGRCMRTLQYKENAGESDIQQGDKVLLRQKRDNGCLPFSQIIRIE